MAFTLPVFRLDRFTFEIPTFSDNSFRDIFKSITTDNYIKCGKYENIRIQESNYIKNSEGKLFYDAMWILGDGEVKTFYSAMYPLFEKDTLLLKFKISGTKSQEIAAAIKNIYNCINKWLSIHSISELSIPNSMVMNGRLYLEYDINFNQYMKNNIAISNQF